MKHSKCVQKSLKLGLCVVQAHHKSVSYIGLGRLAVVLDLINCYFSVCADSAEFLLHAHYLEMNVEGLNL